MISYAVRRIDVTNVLLNIIKRKNNVGKIRKNVSNRLIKTLPKFVVNPTIIFAH